MRVLLTGGGTAGHVYPLLSVWQELKKRVKEERLEVLYVGSKGIEQELVKKEKIPFFSVYSGKWRRYWKKWPPALFLNLFDFFKIFLGFFQAFFIVVRFRPEIILAKGGYVTLPIILASLFCRIPVITHESDVVMGLSNKISAKIAQKICVSFPVEFYKDLPQDKMVETGNPVRPAFAQAMAGKKEFKSRDKKLPTVLITGGSQGSKKINQIIFLILPRLLEFSKVIHLTGSLDYQEALLKKKNLNKAQRKRYFVFDFLDEEMPEVMKKTSLIISRAGANTLAEIAALGKPSILIPLPLAASDHQTKNALIFREAKAAILLKEEKISEATLLNEIKKLIKKETRLKEMGESAKELSKPEAASLIVDEILKFQGV